eukprot:1046892-Prorocentrum_minimum.AAC.1
MSAAPSTAQGTSLKDPSTIWYTSRGDDTRKIPTAVYSAKTKESTCGPGSRQLGWVLVGRTLRGFLQWSQGFAWVEGFDWTL